MLDIQAARMYLFIKFNNNWKRGIISLSFLLISSQFNSQAFIRFSDGKSVEYVNIISNNKSKILNRANFKDYKPSVGDKILYDQKLLDFAIDGNTLFFFDKVKEIDEIQLINRNFNIKKEKTVKSTENKKAFADIFPNNLIATLVNINVDKETFVKSVTFFPDKRFTPTDLIGKIQIQIMNNIDGFPDKNKPILIFEKNISEVYQNKWEIELPRIVKYPDKGFFVTFYYQSNNNKTVVLKLNNESDMFMFYPQINEWKSIKNNGYLYKIKILQ